MASVFISFSNRDHNHYFSLPLNFPHDVTFNIRSPPILFLIKRVHRTSCTHLMYSLLYHVYVVMSRNFSSLSLNVSQIFPVILFFYITNNHAYMCLLHSFRYGFFQSIERKGIEIFRCWINAEK